MAGPVNINNNRRLPLAKQLEAFRAFKSSYPRFVGNLAVNFYKDSFRRQGFIQENRLEKWEPRKNPDKKGRRRAILVKYGALRRSIRVIRSGLGYVVVGTDMAYAQIHNKGGVIRATQRVSSFRRKAYTRKWKGKRQRISASQVKAHSRRVNTTIPQRQLIGPSAFLNRRIAMQTEYRLKQILNIR